MIHCIYPGIYTFRYYAILHPMKAKYMCTISQARKIIFGIWVASFLLAVPNLITQVSDVNLSNK